MRARVHEDAKKSEGGKKKMKKDKETMRFSLPLSLSLLEQCKARVNDVNMRGGQAGVTALSQVKSRLTPLITQI